MQNSLQSPLKQNQFSPVKQSQLKPAEDFNKKLSQILELNLISIKQHAALAKKKFAVDQNSKENIEKQIKKQINENNHLVYNYLQEEDMFVMKYLVMGLYNIFIGYEQKESLFQKFRILNDEPLKLQMQDVIILEKKLQERNKIIEQSKETISLLQQKIDSFDVKIDKARLTISQNKKMENNVSQLESNLQAKEQYIQDIKRQFQLQLEEIKTENKTLQERLNLLHAEKQQLNTNLKNIKKANMDLDLALKKSNLICKQLSEKIEEIDHSHYQFMAKGQTILSSAFNPYDNSVTSTFLPPQVEQSFDPQEFNEKMYQQQIQQQINQLNFEANDVLNSSKIQSIGITTPQNPDSHKIKFQQNQFTQQSPQQLREKTIFTPEKSQSENLNYRYEFIKLAEFLLSISSMVQSSGGNLSIAQFKQILDQKKTEIQPKYIVATSMNDNNLESSQKINKQQQNIQQNQYINQMKLN
ncbi:F-actin capping protein alpha subunit containing protein (macronuclear) [Tetrahymena thermophila SB210]|uniref:F-actin capping protein alpha subunit containing protein n=1 Tax=Tetrahymena thermophila (strain SB210) TaxID=312017 RepID=Q22Z50_TETTS|nr:F-actin capping protein alpha subunit containing protein [Tetrahymena thermophila SB210]EAR90471.3 F-actin capping protein alpha subunit containing protein [Tetrahymena thermophila SB210]|eukprot:XP_001010716.3 F-actin capping protein alpha subunit containing protein [Tetrahymena thermophila SB210]